MVSLGTVAECGEKNGETVQGTEPAGIDKRLLSEEGQEKDVNDWKFETDDDYIKCVEEIMKHAEDDQMKFSNLSFPNYPPGWLKEYVNNRKFRTDAEYIKFVCEILKLAENTSLRNRVCPPFWIAVALVNEDHLNKLDDPMSSAMKLQFLIRELMKQSDDLYLQHYQTLLAVPTQFAVELLNECLSPNEVKKLMKIEDMTVLHLEHLHLAKIKDVVASPLYRSVYNGDVFWREPCLGLSSPFSWQGLKRFILLILWNVLYLPAEIFRRLYKPYISSKYDYHKQLFSPVSFFFADLVNYIIMAFLLFSVISHSHISSRQKATRDLVNQLKAGEITIDEDSRFINESDGIVKVELEKSPVRMREWVLLACIVSRILCELYQLVNEEVVSRTASSSEGDDQETFKFKCRCFYKKLMQYIKKDMNKIDCALIVTLLVAFSFKLHYVYKKSAVYGRVCLMKDGCKDDGLDYSLEARRIVYMIHVYSIAGLLTLVRMFYSIFLFVPLIGPILRSIQMMLKDVGRVVLILLFFSAGFFVPLYAIVHCYLIVHEHDSEEKESASANEGDDEEAFKSMRSPSLGVFTMILSMLEGKLTYADDVYISKDPSTNVFLSGILFIYYILIGLLCLNLLIGLITKRYDTMMESKNRDWRFAQFDFLMDYNATSPDSGMPFYFPFCIVYMTWCFLRMIVEKCLPCSRKKRNFSEKKGNVSEKKEDISVEVGGPLLDDTQREGEDIILEILTSSDDTCTRGEHIVPQVQDNPFTKEVLKRRSERKVRKESEAKKEPPIYSAKKRPMYRR